LVILLLSPLAASVPLCCLAAILFVVAWNMSEVPHFVRLVRGSPATDVAVLLITFALTVFVDLVVAVNVGVILAALLFMRRMARSVSVEPQFESTPANRVEEEAASRAIPPGTVVYSIEGPLFFGAAEKLERMLAHIQRPATTLVLRMGHMPFVDATGITAIEQIVKDFASHGAVVILTEVTPTVLRKLTRAGVIAKIGAVNVVGTLEQALAPRPPVDPQPLTPPEISQLLTGRSR
jgi:SulP family sulfate permease